VLQPRLLFQTYDGRIQDTAGQFLDVDKQSLAAGAGVVLSLDVVEARVRLLAARQRTDAAREASEAVRRTTALDALARYEDLVAAQGEVAIAREALAGAKALADAQATTLDPASYIPSRKLPTIAKAVNATCDAQDGVTDGVVNDPRRCPFDPATLLCKEGDSEACLTAPQVTALKGLYRGPHDSRGREIFPGYVPGAEEGRGGWGPWITGPEPGKSLLFAFGVGYFTNMVYEKADWNYKDANIEQALKAAEEKTAHKLDATDPNLTAFKARGGKLILYHGWNDPAISALNTIHYYDSVVSRLGRPETDAFVRLYMVPGMQHCGDGPGPNSFGQSGTAPSAESQRDAFVSLEQWVERGQAPSVIVATKFVDDDSAKGVKATRPLCPYPQTATYKGQGDPNDAGNFVCSPGK